MATVANVEQNLELEASNLIEVWTVIGVFGAIVGALFAAGLATAVVAGGVVAGAYKLLTR